MHANRSMILVLTALLVIGSAPARGAPSDDAEIRIGRDYARRIELEYKVVTDPALADRVARIGQLIAQTSERPTLPWSFKVIEFAEPNAVALPGGFVYVTKPMLSFVRSDHELAAVLAHEVAHTARRHQMEMIRRTNQAMFWTLILVAITGDPNLAAGAQLISYGLLSGYTRELEREADLISIGYLARTPYTPVASLTLMERLLRDERFRATVDPGAFRDHPRTEERVDYILTELRRRGIPIVRRTAANFLRISTQVVTDGAREIVELSVNDAPVVRLPDPARIAGMAAVLDRFFDSDPDPGLVTTIRLGDTWEIIGGGNVLLTIRSADSAFLGVPAADAAAQIQSRLRWAIEQDRRKRQFNG